MTSKRTLARRLWESARRRAEEQGLPFDIEPSDIVVPHFCPVLGFPLAAGVGQIHDGSPTVDRIVPERGYVKGNIVVVSFRANRLKNNASVDELRRIASFYDQLSE